jgi:protein subunit release factor B
MKGNASQEFSGPSDAAPSREARLAARMASLKIREEDLEESFTHSGGPGGQNVNKTSTAVVLKHRPTGLQVRCEEERSQARNRVLARQLLLDKIAEQRRQTRAADRSRIEKLRRQKRPRPRAIREGILKTKARQSVKKLFRRKPGEE